MSDNVYLVFSRRPEQIGRDEYHAWYEHHAQENIESPGFVSAQRYVAREVVKRDEVGPEHHLALYHFEGDMSRWRTDLTRRIETGDVVLPPWFGDIAFTSWRCTPEGGLLLPHR